MNMNFSGIPMKIFKTDCIEHNLKYTLLQQIKEP